MIDFLKRNSLLITIVLILGTIIFYWFYWHLKPFTTDAFVFANSRPVSPWVEGFITEVRVKNNQFVKKGDVFFVSFQEPYILRVGELEHEIASKREEIKVIEAQIKITEAQIRQYNAELLNNEYLHNQAKEMLAKQAISATYTEEKLRAKEIAEAKVKGAIYQLELEHAKISVLKSQIAKLIKQLDLNKLWLELTEVKALADGYITNLTITEGGYYRPGDVLCGFIDNRNWFVQANFKESELSQIKKGTPAKIRIRQYPGRIYHGTVCNINWGAERRLTSAHTGVADVKKENAWFMLPQRYPVQIKILDPDRDLHLHFGGSAYVELDIPSYPFRQFFWELFLWK
jgi:multidrug resistance efflux pump